MNLSLNDTTELRRLILDNPDLPLLIFCGDEAYTGDYPYNQANVNSCTISELTLYGDMWLGEDELKSELTDDLCDEYDYLTDDEYEKMIEKRVEETEFVKAIVVYVG